MAGPFFMERVMASFHEPMHNHKFWRAVTGEFLAMFIFVYVCVGCALTNLGVVEGSLSSLGVMNNGDAAVKVSFGASTSIAMCFGFTIFVLIHCFAHVSGANINPAVTAALTVTGQISVVRGLCYMIAQYAGAILAGAALMCTMALTPDTMGGFNALTGPEDNQVARGFWTEFILTGVLVYTVMATVDPNKPNGASQMGPLAIGMAVFVAHLIAVPITGCGINPARSVGAAVWSNNDAAHKNLWVFIVAPYLGGILAALLYVCWFAEHNFANGLRLKPKEDPEEKAEVPQV